MIDEEKIFSILKKKDIIALWSFRNEENFRILVESHNMVCTIQELHDFLINNGRDYDKIP